MFSSQEEIEIIKYLFEQAGMGYYFLRADTPVPTELPENEQLKNIYENFYFYDCNDFLARIYGYKSAEDIKGKKAIEIQAFPEDFLRDFIRKGYKLFEVETYKIEKDGKEKWFLNNSTGIVKDGFLLFIYGTQQDITERKWKEKYKIHPEEKEIILNSVDELIAFLDKDLRVKWANKAAGDSLNLKPESLIDKHCYELWHGGEKVCEGCPVHKAILTGLKQEGEITTPDGRIWFIRGYPVKDQYGEILGAIEVTLEITGRKRMEKALVRRNEILSTISLASQLFLSGESFENIVNSILERLGRTLEVSRAYLFENKRDERGTIFTSIRYEWVAEGIEPQIDKPELQNFPWIEKGFERQVRMFERKEPVYGFVRDFPEAERKIFESQGIISILTVPIFVDHEWWGFIGFDECLKEREWAEAEIDAIKLLAVVIGAAIKRRKIETQLKEREEKFRLLAERAQDLIYRYEFYPKRGFTFVSPSATKMTGYTPEEHYADPELGFKIVHPEDRHILEKMARGEQDYEKPILLRWIKKNGEILWTEQYNTPVFDKSGRLIAIEGIARDVTERKKMEERIKLQTRYFEGLFESSPFAIAIVDKDGKIIRINREFEKLFGWREEEIKGAFLDDIVIESERKEEALSLTEKILKGEIVLTEGIRIRKDGSKILTSITGHLLLMDDEIIGHIAIYQDITEKREIEKRTKLQTRYFEGLFEFSPLAIAILDKDGKIIRINRGFENLFGWKEEEIKGIHIDDIIIEPERKEEALALTIKASKGDIVLTEGSRICKDGSRIMVSIIAHPIIIDQELVAQIGIYRDITERYLMEQAIVESETKFRSLTEKSLVGVYLFQDGIFVYVNPKFEEITGYSADELIGKIGPKELVHPEDWPLVEENIMKRLRGERQAMHYEFRGIRKDGEVIYVEIHSSLIIYKGKPAIMGTVLDITDRKLAEKTIKESEEKYRRLFEGSKDGIFISTPDGKIVDANPAMVEIYGYPSKEELINTPVEKLFLSPQEREEYRKKLEKDGYVKDYELRGKRKDGTPLILLETSVVERDEKGNITAYIGIMRDVTAQRKIEEQLIQSAKMEAIGRLAGGIAHDFNNILTIISGNAELLITKFLPESSEFKKIKQIIDSSKRATELTKQLLTISKRGISEPKVLNLNQVIDSMKDILIRLIGEDIEFEFILEPSLKNVKADIAQIEQVLMNLVINAREAMPKGGRLTIKTENIYLDEEHCTFYPGLKEGEYILLSIADSGIGIPHEIMPKIFEPFFSTKPGGTGLGLSTVYGIVKQLNGNISVYSETGKGTTFHIYIPVCEEKEESKLEERGDFKNLPKGNETILVIDDEAQIVEYIEAVLSPLGYNLINASSEKEAMDKLKLFTGEIDLLLTDVVLPGKGGPEIAKELANIYPEIKILFMSGYPDEKIQVSEILRGEVNFISKPFSPFILARKIREILDKT